MTHSPPPDTLWRTRLQALADGWPRMYEEAEALHQVRVASRRLRETLPVFSDGRRRKKFRKARRSLRKITRSLGPVRELDVAIKTLSEVEAKDPTVRSGIDHLRDLLVAERAEKRAEMVSRLEGLAPEKLEQRLLALTDGRIKTHKRRTDPSRRHDARVWRSVLSARMARRAKALRAAVQRAGAIYLPDRLHVVRVMVKKLRYAVEVGRDARVRGTGAMIRTLKYMQDTLGRLHDFEVLIDRARAAESTLKAGAPQVGAELAALIARLEQECRQLHARFVARRDELRVVCDRAADSKRTLASIHPKPVRVLRAGAVSARPPRRDRAADEPIRGVRERDGRHA